MSKTTTTVLAVAVLGGFAAIMVPVAAREEARRKAEHAVKLAVVKSACQTEATADHVKAELTRAGFNVSMRNVRSLIGGLVVKGELNKREVVKATGNLVRWWDRGLRTTVTLYSVK